MASDDSNGMSLTMVSVLVLSLMSYLLWGGAAAIYKGHIDELQAQLDIEQEVDEGLPTNMPNMPHISIHRSRSLAAVQGIGFSIAGVLLFISNSFSQLGNVGDVLPYMLAERKGYLIFSTIVLSITVLGLYGLARMQKSLAAENPFSRRRGR